LAEGRGRGADSQCGRGYCGLHRMGAMGGRVRRGDRVCNRLVPLAAASSGLKRGHITSLQMDAARALLQVNVARTLQRARGRRRGG
jgi:hypothetical protein